jgi:hypothetical protein
MLNLDWYIADDNPLNDVICGTEEQCHRVAKSREGCSAGTLSAGPGLFPAFGRPKCPEESERAGYKCPRHISQLVYDP